MTQKLHSVLERVSSLFRSQLRDVASAHGLKLVQLEALIYLATANRYSDTAGAAAEYLGTTKGTASQTVLALERHGLIEKTADPNDRRVLHCRLTPAGEEIVEASYPAEFLTGIEAAEAEQAAVVLLRALQASGGFRTFGQCETCTHFLETEQGGRCGLTGEDLRDEDKVRFCREHAV